MVCMVLLTRYPLHNFWKNRAPFRSCRRSANRWCGGANNHLRQHADTVKTFVATMKSQAPKSVSLRQVYSKRHKSSNGRCATRHTSYTHTIINLAILRRVLLCAYAMRYNAWGSALVVLCKCWEIGTENSHIYGLELQAMPPNLSDVVRAPNGLHQGGYVYPPSDPFCLCRLLLSTLPSNLRS